MPINIENLQKSFGDQQVLKNFNHTFADGKIYCLFGPSGCGKTTLLHIMTGILPFDRGTITGLENKKIAVVFQEDRLLPWLTAEENIEFVLADKKHRGETHLSPGDYLDIVGLREFKEYLPHRLSGGMARRVALARAFAYQGQILLLDEPFKGIDDATKENIMDFMLQNKENNKEQIIIFTTHNLEEAAYLAHETVKFAKE